MEVDFRNNSVNIDDFPIEIDNDFLSILLIDNKR